MTNRGAWWLGAMAESLTIRTGWIARGLLPVVLALAVVPARAQIPCGYEVTEIQAPPYPPFGVPPAIGTGLNELGDVVGYYSQGVAPGNEAFLWTRESGLLTLSRPPGVSSAWARDINDDLQIVGEMILTGNGNRGFTWQAGEWIELAPAGDGNHCGAYANNASGAVVGYRDHDEGKGDFRCGFLWADGAFTDILPTYGPTLIANDVQDRGQIVGWMGVSTPDRHAFLWDTGELTDLGVIPGGYTGSATAINRAGQIAIGGRFNPDHPSGFISGGFLWRDGMWTDLGMLLGYDSMAVTGLNNSATVVGWCRAINSGDALDAGFVWHAGMMVKLNDLIPSELGMTIKQAEAINDAGQITGRALNAEGLVVAVLLTPLDSPLGDLDGDCHVAINDFLLLLSEWGPCNGCPADLDGDGIVGILDFLILLANWG